MFSSVQFSPFIVCYFVIDLDQSKPLKRIVNEIFKYISLCRASELYTITRENPLLIGHLNCRPFLSVESFCKEEENNESCFLPLLVTVKQLQVYLLS